MSIQELKQSLIITLENIIDNIKDDECLIIRDYLRIAQEKADQLEKAT